MRSKIRFILYYFTALFSILQLTSCNEQQSFDLLPSWNEGTTKAAIIDFIDDKDGKPVGIHKFIGRKPVLASGNSDGDLQMLQCTESGTGKRFMLYLHHTDSIREWAYDRESHIGRLEKGLDEANEKGWTVINMKEDWKAIYPFELEQ